MLRIHWWAKDMAFIYPLSSSPFPRGRDRGGNTYKTWRAVREENGVCTDNDRTQFRWEERAGFEADDIWVKTKNERVNCERMPAPQAKETVCTFKMWLLTFVIYYSPMSWKLVISLFWLVAALDKYPSIYIKMNGYAVILFYLELSLMCI